jgi:putative transposase
MTLFKNKYRIESVRLKGYNYSSPGEYFITICTGGRIKWFGNVVNGEMKRNEMGEIAHQSWMEIPNHHTNVLLDEFIVMPNHVHGIIVLCGNVACNPDGNVENENCRDVVCNVSTTGISPKRGSLGAIIRSYKSAVTNGCHTRGHDKFTWQSRFYDHIIRDEKGLNEIRFYIRNNPSRWEFDRNNH